MDDWIEKLEQLTRLRQSNALTDQEFESEKLTILANANSPRDPTVAPIEDSEGSFLDPYNGQTFIERITAHPKLLALAAVISLGALGSMVALNFYPHNDLEPPKSNRSVTVATPAEIRTTKPIKAAIPAPLNLDAELSFSDAANCKASPKLDATFEKMLSRASNSDKFTSRPIVLGQSGLRLSPVFKSTMDSGENQGAMTSEASVRLPQSTFWHGLRVSRLIASYYDVPDSDGSYTRKITFIETTGRVREALNQSGFKLPASPKSAELDDGVCGGSMEIVPVPGGSALQCGWGC